MRKIRFWHLIIGVIVLAMMPTHARATFGVQAGINLGDVSTDPIQFTTSSRFGLAGGIHFEKELVPMLVFLQPELMYVQRGYKTNMTGIGEVTAKIDYLEMPILIKLSFGALLSFEVFGGPSIAYAINKSASNSSVTLSVKSLDYGLHAGGGIAMELGPLGVFANARYVLGLNNISDVATYTLKNRGFMFLVGARFGM